MKKFQSLGKSLSKSEQRSIMGGLVDQYEGGSGSMFCLCVGSGSSADVVVCSFHSFSGWASCLSGSQNYCSSTYGGSTDCSFSYQG